MSWSPNQPSRCTTYPVRGKVDGAFLGPFEGLRHIPHVTERKFYMVIGHQDAVIRKEEMP